MALEQATANTTAAMLAASRDLDERGEDVGAIVEVRQRLGVVPYERTSGWS